MYFRAEALHTGISENCRNFENSIEYISKTKQFLKNLLDRIPYLVGSSGPEPTERVREVCGVHVRAGGHCGISLPADSRPSGILDASAQARGSIIVGADHSPRKSAQAPICSGVVRNK